MTGSLKAEENKIEEDKLKAVCLYNFLIFVNWPSFVHDKITIGILGDEPLEGVFDEVIGKPVKGTDLPLDVKYFGPFERGIDLSECTLIFIRQSERRHFDTIREYVKNKPILTVSEYDTFLDKGGIDRKSVV